LCVVFDYTLNHGIIQSENINKKIFVTLLSLRSGIIYLQRAFTKSVQLFAIAVSSGFFPF